MKRPLPAFHVRAFSYTNEAIFTSFLKRGNFTTNNALFPQEKYAQLQPVKSHTAYEDIRRTLNEVISDPRTTARNSICTAVTW
jgi:hypothetical protein